MYLIVLEGANIPTDKFGQPGIVALMLRVSKPPQSVYGRGFHRKEIETAPGMLYMVCRA